jgi:hypothetical protein
MLYILGVMFHTINNAYAQTHSTEINCSVVQTSPCYKAITSDGHQLKEFLIMKPGDVVVVGQLTKRAEVCDATYPFVASKCDGTPLFPRQK